VEVTPTIRCFGHRPAVPDRQRHVHDSDTSTAPQRLRLQAVDDGAPAPPLPARATDSGDLSRQETVWRGSLVGTVGAMEVS